jgi:hypothetical protein
VGAGRNRSIPHLDFRELQDYRQFFLCFYVQSKTGSFGVARRLVEHLDDPGGKFALAGGGNGFVA